VLAAAVEGNAGYIVSGDSDLLVLEQYEEIRIVTPRQFLSVLPPVRVPRRP
jgi:predicted nucleic acid-binding protein